MSSTLNNVLNAVIDLAENTNPYASIIIGNTPPDNGIAMFTSSGYPDVTNLDKGMLVSIHIMCNAKHRNQDIAFDTLSNIHKELTKSKTYPNTEDFQIMNIASATYPTLIGREDNGQYVFGSTLQIYFYWR